MNGIHFIRQSRAEGEFMDGNIVGQVVVVDGCLRISSRPGIESYLLLWPAGYTISVDGDDLEVRNANGEPVVLVGETVTLGGGGAQPTGSSDSDHRRWVNEQLEHPVPDQCAGPYWWVSPG
jgi:hypothetical protein